MAPKPEHLHDAILIYDLVDQSVLDIDSPGIASIKVALELLKGRRALKGIGFKNGQQVLGLFPEAGGRELFCVLLGVP